MSRRCAVALANHASFTTWRDKARALLAAAIAPEDVDWSIGEALDLLPAAPIEALATGAPSTTRVPRSFVERAEIAAMHCDPSRFALLYRVLWRLTHGEAGLLDVAVDADVVRIESMARSVRRDMHKMKAFVRFREAALLEGQADHRFFAWFEPEHFIVEAVAPFFVRRFTNMRFSIVTPQASVHWDCQTLAFGPGGQKSDVPAEDAGEQLWRTYYANIFNPARLKLAAMQGEMPKKYWKNLPEAELIAPLAAAARRLTEQMIDAPSSVPARRLPAPAAVGADTNADLSSGVGQTLSSVRAAADKCRSCELWRDATQTVFGEGPAGARVMLVGEQPGDQEDLAGHPFVGPAGQLLDRALAAAGVSRQQLYVTNAVKHFKFVVRGKRRLHQSPKVIEIDACAQWLEHEIALVQPELIVALGATAAQALLHKPTAIKANRGRLLPFGAAQLLITVHPSYLLRLPDASVQAAELALFEKDLGLIAAHLALARGEKK